MMLTPVGSDAPPPLAAATASARDVMNCVWRSMSIAVRWPAAASVFAFCRSCAAWYCDACRAWMPNSTWLAALMLAPNASRLPTCVFMATGSLLFALGSAARTVSRIPISCFAPHRW